MRDKKETLDKKINNLKLKKLAKKQKLQEQGITLIALVVTIIILLILAGVTLNIALSDNGLFSKAKKATEDYKQAQSEEEDLISQFATQMYSEYVGATVEGYSLENNKEKSITITSEESGINKLDSKDHNGYNIDMDENGNQTFTTEENINWRVWDFDGNTLRIIGNSTSQTLALKEAAGYNNGVWLVDKICNELYTNGKEGVSATNLKRTDIQKVSTYDYTKYKHQPNTWEEDTSSEDSDGNLIHFGQTKTYTDYHQYPDIWEEYGKDWTYKYDKGIITGKDKECKIWEEIGKGAGQTNEEIKKGSESTVFKESYYYHKYKQNEFINSAYYDLIFGKTDEMIVTGSYWLAGRHVQLFESFCSFGMHMVSRIESGGVVWGHDLINSTR